MIDCLSSNLDFQHEVSHYRGFSNLGGGAASYTNTLLGETKISKFS